MRNIIFILFIIFLAYTTHAQVSPQAMSLQGRILDPSNAPLEAANVQYTLQVYSPGAEECLLFEETHIIDMTGSGGVFSLNLGAGTRAGVAFKDTSTLAQIFNNASGAMTSLACAVGTSYTPASVAKRKIKMTFDAGTGPQVVSQMLDLQSVPFALYADTLQGKTPTNFVQVTADTTQAKVDALMLGATYTELMAIINGTTTQYVKAGGTNFLPVATVDFNNQRITNLAAPTVASDAVNKTYSDTKFGGSTLDLAGLADGQSIRWNNAGTKWEVYTPSTLDATKLPLAGGTMTGAINMGGNDLLATGHITMSAQKGLNLGTYTNAQEATLVAGLGAANKGLTWYNTDSGQIKYWGGSAPAVVVGNGIVGSAATEVTSNANIPMCLSNQKLQMSAGPVYTFSCVTDNAGQWVTTGSDIYYNTGNVGIGTATPDSRLTVGVPNAGGWAFKVKQTTAGSTGFMIAEDGSTRIQAIDSYTGSVPLQIYGRSSMSAHYLDVFDKLSNPIFHIDSSGNVGIATTTPAAKLDVAGDIKMGDSSATCNGTTEGSQRYNTTTNKMQYCDGVAWSDIDTVGGVGTVTDVTASAPLASSGGATPNISLTGTVPVANGGTGATSVANNLIFAGPAAGGPLAPSFRALTASDIPSLSGTYLPLAGGDLTGSLHIGAAGAGFALSGVAPENLYLRGDNFFFSNPGYTFAGQASITVAGNNPLVTFQHQLTGYPTMILRGAAAQTAPLLQIEDSTTAVKTVIKSDGSVGIGTTSPEAGLHIKSNVEAQLKLTNDSTAQYSSSAILLENSQVTDGNQIWKVFADKAVAGAATGGSDFIIRRSNSAQTIASTPFLIDSSNNILLQIGWSTGGATYGNVGIGTGTPAALLDVGGNIKIGDSGVVTCDATTKGSQRYNSTSNKMEFCNGTAWGLIDTSGGSGTVTNIAVGSGLTGGPITTTGTIGLDAELAAVNALATTGFVKRTGAGAYSTAASIDLAADVGATLLPIANGGTGQSTKGPAFNALSPMSAIGDLIYGGAAGTGTRLPAGTAGQILQTNGAAAPAWTTATYPATTTANQILVSTSNNVVAGLATSNGAALVTDGAGIPGYVSGITGQFLKGVTAGSPTFGTIGTGDLPDLSGSYLPIAGGTLTNSLTVTNTLSVGNGVTLGDTSSSDQHSINGKVTQTANFADYATQLKNFGAGTVLELLTAGGLSTETAFSVTDPGTSTKKFVVMGNGVVGIGTTAPSAMLDIDTGGSVITGTVATTAASAVLTGTGTNFTSALSVGKYISVNGEVKKIASIGSDTSLTVDTNFSVTLSGSPVFKVALNIDDGHVRVGGSVVFSTSGDDNIGGRYNSEGVSDIFFDGGSNSLSSLILPEEGASDQLRVYDFDGTGAIMTWDDSGNVGIGTTTPTTGTRLDITGTTAADSSIIVPRAPVADRPTGVNGMIRYASDTNKFEAYQNGAWTDMIGVTSASSVAAGNGTFAAPSMSFSGDPNTGLYSNGADIIGVTAGGANIFNMSSAGMVSATSGGALITTANGVVGAPTYSFAGDPDTGWWHPAADTLAASTGGVERVRITSSGGVGFGGTPNSYNRIYGFIGNTSTTGTENMYEFNSSYVPSASAAGSSRNNIFSYGYIPNSATNAVGSVMGVNSGAENYANVAVDSLTGVYGYARNDLGAAGVVWGGDFRTSVNGGTVGDATAVNIRNYTTGGSTSATIGVLIDGGNFSGGTITNRYGIKINTPGGAGVPTNDFGIWQQSANQKNYFGGNVGIGTTTPGEKLEVAGNIRASGQLSTGSQTVTGGTSSIDWNNGNAISTDYNCASSPSFVNLRDGGTYTLVVTDASTTQCSFSTTTTGTDAATVTYRYRPANNTRTASTHTVYTLMRVGTVIYVSWASGF